MMKTWVNEGSWDRWIRVIVGLALLVVGVYTPVVAPVAFDVVGIVLVLTGITGFCLLYKILGINTTGHQSVRS